MFFITCCPASHGKAPAIKGALSRVKEGCVLGLGAAQCCLPSTNTNFTLQILNKPGPGAVGRAVGGDLGSPPRPQKVRKELFPLDTNLWVTEKQSKAPTATVTDSSGTPAGRCTRGGEPRAAAGPHSREAVHGACLCAGGPARCSREGTGGQPDGRRAQGGE